MPTVRTIRVGQASYDVVLHRRGTRWRGDAVRVALAEESGRDWGRDTHLWVSGGSEREVLRRLRELLEEAG